ncbi:SARP family transcriptional regulator [Streptomyces sp. Ru73]|uniref:AfsR/SARP family transcriptional regulator n=1 Tax=Streptomyces sp. Ru73 TaxID=2080748 RepID=UPI000CDD3976|nr:BTAD domain-containing putative transcriptional regulator [Streptomyces sp. Ru73]POX37197.1 SARP family transcriptional regulator [Streptomyces sp. Ru73]
MTRQLTPHVPAGTTRRLPAGTTRRVPAGAGAGAAEATRATGSGPAAHLQLLGSFALQYGAEAAEATETAEVCASGQRVLAYLALRQRAARTVLAGTLWPDVTENHALGSLRTTLWRLRHRRPSLVRSDRDVLALADTVRVDVRDLSRCALQALRPDAKADSGPQLGSLLTGDLLPGWDEDWVVLERERLRQLRLHALETLAGSLTARGQHALALEAALECVRTDPLRESAHRAVVTVHLAEHNIGEAIRHYQSFRRLLHRELGVEPSGQFRALIRRTPPSAPGPGRSPRRPPAL